MVGYQRGDSLTHKQKLLAACVTGTVTRFITQPIDIIKLRTQLQRKQSGTQMKISEITKNIIKEEGLVAFFHGHCIGQLHSIAQVTTQFFTYELATKYVEQSDLAVKHKPAINFFCGIFAGCCSATVSLPLEVIRVRQMIARAQYKGIINGAKEVYNTGGVLAFYEGFSASLIQLGPSMGISFSVFRYLQPMILEALYSCGSQGKNTPINVNNPSYLIVASIIAGAAAGFVSKTATYPFDLIKRRLQISTHKQDYNLRTPSASKQLVRCDTFLNCITQTVKQDGLRGLYQGWSVTVVKSQLTSIVAFTTYELTCYSIREFNSR